MHHKYILIGLKLCRKDIVLSYISMYADLHIPLLTHTLFARHIHNTWVNTPQHSIVQYPNAETLDPKTLNPNPKTYTLKP